MPDMLNIVTRCSSIVSKRIIYDTEFLSSLSTPYICYIRIHEKMQVIIMMNRWNYSELNGYNKHCFTSQNQHIKIASWPIENQDGWWALFYFNRDIILVTRFIVHSSGLWLALSFNEVINTCHLYLPVHVCWHAKR